MSPADDKDNDISKKKADDAPAEETPTASTPAKDDPVSEEKPAQPEAETPAAPPEKKEKKAKAPKAEEGTTAPEPAEPVDATADDSGAEAKKPKSDFDWQLRVQHLLRFVLMLIAGVGVSITASVLYAITFVQFIYILVTGEKLNAATQFCSRLSIYVHQLLDFICYRSNDVIFPLAAFPEAPDGPIETADGVTIDGKAEKVKD